VDKLIPAIEELCFRRKGFCLNLAKAFSSINVNCTCDSFGLDGGNRCFVKKPIRIRTFMGEFRAIPASKGDTSIVLLATVS